MGFLLTTGQATCYKLYPVKEGVAAATATAGWQLRTFSTGHISSSLNNNSQAKVNLLGQLNSGAHSSVTNPIDMAASGAKFLRNVDAQMPRDATWRTNVVVNPS